MRSPHALALADFNRDGRADLLVTGEESDEVRVFFARL
jgi:FG-GAP repeat